MQTTKREKLNNLLLKISPDSERVDFFMENIKKIEQLTSALESKYKDIESFTEKLVLEADAYFSEIEEKIDGKVSEIDEALDRHANESESKDLELEGMIDAAKSELSKISSEATKKIETIKHELSSLIKEASSKIKELNENDSKITKEISENRKYVDSVKKEIKKEISEKLSIPRGGGTMPFQVAVDGTVATKRYADIDFISGNGVTFSVSNDDANKRTKITATAQTGIIEVPTGAVDGVNTVFTFTVAPNAIVVDQGRVMTNGIGYTLVGLVATLDIAPNFSVFSL